MHSTNVLPGFLQNMVRSVVNRAIVLVGNSSYNWSDHRPVERTMREDVIHAAPIEEFDFERVAATMKAVNWEWGAFGEIPTANMLRGMVQELMAEWGKPLRRADGTFYIPREIASGGIGIREQDGSVVVFFARNDDHLATHQDVRKEWAKAKRK